jgi:hypothetical protein
LVADERAVVTVVEAAQLGWTSPEARQTWLEVVLAAPVSDQVVLLAFRQASLEPGQQLAPVWLSVQKTWLEVALAVLVSAQVVPLASRQALPEQEW